LVANKAATRQDQNPQAFQGQEAPRPSALILPEMVPEKILRLGYKFAQWLSCYDSPVSG
jgi:hypothetical protein